MGGAFEDVFTEISQRTDDNHKGESAKRFDGALVLKKDYVYSVVVVELKVGKT